MRESNKNNNSKSKSKADVIYRRIAPIKQNHINDELSASEQIDRIKTFAQAQGIQVVMDLAK